MTDGMNTRKERFLRKFAALIVWTVFRKVDVYRAGPTTSEPGPLMSTANHFGGFLDPILAMYAVPRRPRFIARDVIWKIPVARSLMDWIGAIPVHKADDKGAGSNDQMFRSCYEALRDGGHLLIFPEGITRDEPSIGSFKTGTARIVLGARNTGASGISMVPLGIHYEDKAALRSRASIVVAGALDLDERVQVLAGSKANPGPENREAVKALTAELNERLRRAAPDFVDWREALGLTRAAEITLRSISDVGEPVPLAQRDRLAGILAGGSESERAGIIAAVTSYDDDLDALALDDADLSAPTRRRAAWGRFAARLIIGLLLLPYAIIGFLLNVIPFLLVKAVGLFKLAPSAMASLKPIVAILAFGATWSLAVWAVLMEVGWMFAAAAVLVLPLYSAATVVLWERIVLGTRFFRARRLVRVQKSTRETLLDRRSQVVGQAMDSI